jgi:hypothetical protein
VLNLHRPRSRFSPLVCQSQHHVYGLAWICAPCSGGWDTKIWNRQCATSSRHEAKPQGKVNDSFAAALVSLCRAPHWITASSSKHVEQLAICRSRAWGRRDAALGVFAVIADCCIGSTVIDDITRAVQGYALHGILRAIQLLQISSNGILPGDVRTIRRQVRCVGCIELYHVIELFRVPVRPPCVADVSNLFLVG